MSWQTTAQELVAAFQQVKATPLSYPHKWVLRADNDTYCAVRNLHQILCSRLNGPAVLAALIAIPISPPCTHPKTPPSHLVKPWVGGNYSTPAIALLAWQLASELATAFPQYNGIPPLDANLVLVQAYVRDAADCD